jgi:RND family efflux transporter MFP subunit
MSCDLLAKKEFDVNKILTLPLLMLLLPLPALAAQLQSVAARVATQQETLTGFTREAALLVVSTEVAGRVERVTADVGDRLEKGTSFACLDTTFIDLEIRANQAEQQRLQVDITHYSKQVKRFSRLLQQKSSSQSQLDESERALQSSRAQLVASQVQAQILRERRQRHCVAGPAGWRVIERHVEPGQWLNIGTPVVTLGDYSRLIVPFALNNAEFTVLERQAGDLKLRLPDRGGEVTAQIEHVSPAFDPVSRKIQVELAIEQPMQQPRGGIRAELRLELPASSGTVLLPRAALSERYEQHWLTRADGEQLKVVYLGVASGVEGEWVRVAAPGLKAGDRFQLPAE